ncbi:efflux RND transporter periplasmic adaptor subunit [Variovorax sp. 770b2]|uniref:efflux RND transporter periplasmic adaptor subunit n=1 Tax=Variovorax sp. 770b2 TaxID=1566271 RepID=UPI0008EC076B|nr:HlyD family efflux transporter periplasmic adaptor subunit [Variovorax sp. 770b2]SFP18601.1 RND family efflux transporter, MFP subunit [Variovorax sp. 770b2]
MSQERGPQPEPGADGVPVRTLAIGAAFVAGLAAIAWGYMEAGPERKAPPAPIMAVPVTAPAPATVATAPAAAASASAPTSAPAPPADIAATPRPDATAVRGVVKPRDEVLFSAKIAARIAQMPYREGERFQKGAVLVAFDCTRIRAEANAAWAANRASNQVLRQSQELDRYNAIGKTDVQIAKAKAEQSGAEAGALEAQMRDCTIVAPFSGIVVENISHLHENAAAGKELSRVLNDSELEMHLIAPSAWLSWLQPGSPFRFRVDETAASYEGKVARLGASVDPVSQTVRVVGVFSGNRDKVLPGMSGSAEFAQNPALKPKERAGP